MQSLLLFTSRLNMHAAQHLVAQSFDLVHEQHDASSQVNEPEPKPGKESSGRRHNIRLIVLHRSPGFKCQGDAHTWKLAQRFCSLPAVYTYLCALML
jgi:hypothetical protein